MNLFIRLDEDNKPYVYCVRAIGKKNGKDYSEDTECNLPVEFEITFPEG